ncbi:hypothetical protein V6N13_000761 [Hibiscus sabdariffa]|uniref:Uncharacterized protein n=1 Tax=Hibiscus sabdariffa TaxID=183260 RepID=A0ABR2G6L9_9ROSI
MRNKQNKRAEYEISTGFQSLSLFLLERSFREETNELGWKNSFSQGIGITAPKARKRDKAMSWALVL